MELTHVAPLAGAWIEIAILSRDPRNAEVAPLAGAWIEMCYDPQAGMGCIVAPLAGAWIEIEKKKVVNKTAKSRSPRGSVD